MLWRKSVKVETSFLSSKSLQSNWRGRNKRWLTDASLTYFFNSYIISHNMPQLSVPLLIGSHCCQLHVSFKKKKASISSCCVTNHSLKFSGLKSNHLLISMVPWIDWEHFLIWVQLSSTLLDSLSFVWSYRRLQLFRLASVISLTIGKLLATVTGLTSAHICCHQHSG